MDKKTRFCLFSKTGFLPSCSCVYTVLQMHHMDTVTEEKKRDGNYTAGLNKSWKDEQDLEGTTGEVRTN